MVNKTSPWGPKLYLNCDEQNFSTPFPARIRDELLSLPGGIDSINQVLKDKPTYIFYETTTSPILTENKKYQGSKNLVVENVPKPKRNCAKPNKIAQVRDTVKPLKKKRTVTKPRANKKPPKNPYEESEAPDADDEKEEEETIHGSD